MRFPWIPRSTRSKPLPAYAQYLNLMGNDQDRVLSRGDRQRHGIDVWRGDRR